MPRRKRNSASMETGFVSKESLTNQNAQNGGGKGRPKRVQPKDHPEFQQLIKSENKSRIANGEDPVFEKDGTVTISKKERSRKYRSKQKNTENEKTVDNDACEGCTEQKVQKLDKEITGKRNLDTRDEIDNPNKNGKVRIKKEVTHENITDHVDSTETETLTEKGQVEFMEKNIGDNTTDSKKSNLTKSGKTREPRKKRVKKEDDKDFIKEEVATLQSESADSSAKFVGAHVSIAGGLYKAVHEATALGGKAFGMFLKSQRQWAAKPLADKDAEQFKQTCQDLNFSPNMILPHGSYLMNCGSPSEETLQKSRDALVDELQRCEKLGLTLFNFHPGSTCGKIPVEESLNRIAESINIAHRKTSDVITVIENMSCQGNTIGGKFEELRGIIDRVSDKRRMGVCLDTCHAFAAGYDLSKEEGFEKMMKEFEVTVGLQYLKAMHLNDSKGKVGCHLDRHENIGKGFIRKEGFKRIMNDSRLNNIPMILETPCPEDDTYAKEVKLLYSLCNQR